MHPEVPGAGCSGANRYRPLQPGASTARAPPDQPSVASGAKRTGAAPGDWQHTARVSSTAVEDLRLEANGELAGCRDRLIPEVFTSGSDIYERLERGMLATTGIKPNLDFPTGPAYYLMDFTSPTSHHRS